MPNRSKRNVVNFNNEHTSSIERQSIDWWAQTNQYLYRRYCAYWYTYGGNELGQPLARVLACCLTAARHYLKQCWHQQSPLSCTWWQYHSKFSRTQSLIWIRKLHLKTAPSPGADGLITVPYLMYHLNILCCNRNRYSDFVKIILCHIMSYQWVSARKT